MNEEMGQIEIDFLTLRYTKMVLIRQITDINMSYKN